MRWLIGLLVALALLLVAGDALARSFVEGRVEERLGNELDADVSVSLGGFPFVLNLVRGRFPSATLELQDARRRGLDIERVALSLRGVEVSLRGSAPEAVVESGRGRATISLPVLGAFIEHRSPLAVVRFQDEQVTVRVPSLGRAVTVPLTLQDGRLTVEPPVGPPISIPLPRLLKGLEYRSIELTGSSAVLGFALEDATLEAP